MADIWGTHTTMVMTISQCVDECLKCHRICLDTATQCLLIGGDLAAPERVRLLYDAAQICQMAADFILRKSLFHLQSCELCAEICERVVDSCEDLIDDRLMHTCSQAARRCAAACREMVADVV